MFAPWQAELGHPARPTTVEKPVAVLGLPLEMLVDEPAVWKVDADVTISGESAGLRSAWLIAAGTKHHRHPLDGQNRDWGWYPT